MGKARTWLGMAACALLCACGQGGNSGKGAPSPTANATPATPVQTTAAPPPAFAMCSSCHAVEHGRNGIGPSLAGVVGRKAGTLAGYAYSDALKNSGIVWDAKTLDTWLEGPIKMVPGTKMVIGVSDPQGRKAVIDYLRTLK